MGRKGSCILSFESSHGAPRGLLDGPNKATRSITPLWAAFVLSLPLPPLLMPAVRQKFKAVSFCSMRVSCRQLARYVDDGDEEPSSRAKIASNQMQRRQQDYCVLRAEEPVHPAREQSSMVKLSLCPCSSIDESRFRTHDFSTYGVSLRPSIIF